MALYNNPYQYSFGVPGQMNQFQQQPVQIPAQPVQQRTHSTGTRKWSITTLSLMRCVADTMTITASVEENMTAWGDTAQVTAE